MLKKCFKQSFWSTNLAKILFPKNHKVSRWSSLNNWSQREDIVLMDTDRPIRTFQSLLLYKCSNLVFDPESHPLCFFFSIFILRKNHFLTTRNDYILKLQIFMIFFIKAWVDNVRIHRYIAVLVITNFQRWSTYYSNAQKYIETCSRSQ